MIFKKETNQYKEVSFEGDKLKIFRAERIPDGLLKANYIERETPGFKWMDQEKEWHHVARVPKIVMDRLYREYPDEMREPGNKFLYEWLDREENHIWKTYKGKLS